MFALTSFLSAMNVGRWRYCWLVTPFMVWFFATATVTHAEVNIITTATLQHYRALYDGTADSTKIRLRRELGQQSRNQSSAYTLKQNIYSSFVNIETLSTFNLIGERIRPERFHLETKLFMLKEQEEWHFDWDKGVVSEHSEGKELPLHEDSLDPVSFDLQMSNDLRNSKNLPATLVYQVLSSDEVKEFQFELVGRPILETALGHFKTYHYREVGEENSSEIWFAEDWDYLMVRLRAYSDKAKRIIDISLIEATLGSDEVSGLLLH